MKIKIGIVSLEYIEALNNKLLEDVNNSKVNSYYKEKKLEDVKRTIEGDFKNRRPRLIMDYNEDFYLCVGIKSDYTNTFHNKENGFYKDCNAMRKMIYHFETPVIQNGKEVYPYFNMSSSCLVAKDFVYLITPETLKSIEKLICKDMNIFIELSGTLDYIEENYKEIERFTKNYINNSEEIKNEIEQYWKGLKNAGMKKYSGGFIDMSEISRKNNDLHFYKNVYNLATELINDESKNDRQFADDISRLLNNKKKLPHEFLEEVGKIPQIYSKKGKDGFMIATPEKHFGGAVMSVFENKKYRNGYPSNKFLIDTTRNTHILNKQKENSEILWKMKNVKRKSDYINDSNKEKQNYVGIYFDKRSSRPKETYKVYNVNQDIFLSEIIKNTGYIFYTNDENKESKIYSNLKTQRLNLTINPNDSNDEKLKKIISAYMLPYKVPFDYEKKRYEGLENAKYSLYNALSFNENGLSFQLTHYLVVAELNKRTNLNFKIPNYDFLENYGMVILKNKDELTECINDAANICTLMMNRTKNLFNENDKINIMEDKEQER